MFPKLLRERRGTGIALFVVLIISSVAYCESYIPPRLAHKFNRFGDSSAPAFTLQPVSDGAVPVTHTPGKVLVIDFFSTSCAPCIAELPAFAQVYSDLNRNPEIQFVLVASDKGRDTPERFRTFVQKRHISLPLAFDVGGKAHDSLGLTGVPAIVVVDRTGKIRLRREGYNSAETSFRRDLVHLVRSL
jgi:thiol-disulfide isomerase/thioredoxin